MVDDTADLAAATVVLTGAEGRHAAVVRRIRAGETVDLSDGRGERARCTVVEVGRDSVVCEVGKRWHEPAPRPRLTVVQALPKGDRGELAVEMMTEAGVDVIVPWAAERCVTRWKGDRAAKSLAKWRAAAREAAKQARRGRLPEVTGLAGRDDVAALLSGADTAIVLHEDGAVGLSGIAVPDGDRASADDGADHGVVLVVGPEGGFSDAELDAFTGAGARTALLGPSVLRTSTAGVAALSILQVRSGRW
ncbi:16S rRNA methyltransferase [Nocardiopsis sp. NRRL B-16309]|nr:16S rRNA methyltransferase [Nocardiopsis sp. NRRL B-16309]